MTKRTNADRIQRLALQANIADKLAPLMGRDVQQWFDSVEHALVEDMVAAPASDDDGRRAAALELRAWRVVRGHIASCVRSGPHVTEKLKTLKEITDAA